MRPQPLIAVADVEQSSSWYQHVLGAASGHGGPDYEQLRVDGGMILQLHRQGENHHHEPIADASIPVGNGVALWFFTTDFDAAVSRVRGADVTVVTDAHANPNAGHREIWLRDLDGYLVVIAGA